MAWFDCATRRPIGANTGGLLGPNLGLVLHHQAGNGSLHGFFNNPAARVSAHFWVGQSGLIEQYVDTGVVAWHGKSLNSRYIGVETEGCGRPPHADAMSEAMIAALARIYAEGMRRHGWANALANRDGERSFGFHRMAVATGCPCDIRLNLRSEILRRAASGAPAPSPTPPPTQPPPPSGGAMALRATPSGRGYWIVGSDGGIFTHGDAGFHGSLGNQALAAPIVDMAPTPSGGGYWLVGSDGGIFTFGNARFFGSLGGRALAAPIVSIEATPSGGGYWLLGKDGGVFTFGDAGFFGASTGLVR